MFRSLPAIAAAIVACFVTTVAAQPTSSPDQAARAVTPYVYMMDSAGDKVLLQTSFWRNDPKYDERAFHRFLDVMSDLEKRGFQKSDKAVIDTWDKPQPFAKCYIYLEDLQAGKRTKSSVTSGSRIWCSDNGASEKEINGSDTPKHIEQVMKEFDTYLGRAKANLKK